MADTKTPNPETVAKSDEPRATGDARHARTQVAVDSDRGYREIDWKGVRLFQALNGQHTTEDEGEMIRHVNEQRMAALDPLNQRQE